MTTEKKNDCESCASKGFYTQMFGKTYSADFMGDPTYQEPPKIHKIACPKCNYGNKRKLKDVKRNIWE